MVIPCLRYEDAPAAIEFLETAFGFERHLVVEGTGGTIEHAEMRHRDGLVMLGSVREGNEGPENGAIYVVIDDPDAHCERARAAGAEIVMELIDTDYGSRDYAARDPEGNIWNFGTYDPLAPGSNPGT